ncbi:MAG TPA: Hsp20/alpha crystallin family protein [Candidatus Eisenbacteria bacterium]
MKPLTLAPMTGVTNLRNEMDRLLDRFWDGSTLELPAIGERRPAMDVSETNDRFQVVVEMPGMKLEDLDVRLENQVLTITGEKKEEKEETTANFHQRERIRGSFVRRIQLPTAVDPKKVMADYGDGVLTVTLPKLVATEGARIAVHPQK